MSATPKRDLDRLAEALGVEPFYCDIWGQRRDTSDETAAQLVGAMGFPADDDAAAAASLARLTAADWTQLVPSVLTATEGEPVRIPLRLPMGSAGELLWTLWEENGRERFESGMLSLLPLAGGGQVGDSHYVLRLLELSYAVAPGYHRLALAIPDLGLAAEMALIVAPPRCLTPAETLDHDRVWGLSAQLYALRRDGDWGVGDFTALGELAETCAGLGADVIGLNPLHARFPADPGHSSPYSPSSRSFLDMLYIDVEAVPEMAGCVAARRLIAQPAFQQQLALARAAEQVDYVAVTLLKLQVLKALHARFAKQAKAEPDSERAAAYAGFCADAGAELQQHARFDALHEHIFAGGAGPWHWRDWPAEYRDADGPAVAAFAKKHAARVDFFMWLQFEADRQLAAAAARGRAAGLRLGFYRDLAVGADSGGSAAWTDPTALVSGAAVGAPPDLLNLMGQNWGLTPLSPLGLRQRGYAPFISALRANMRHAGALRIDHVMGLMHMFWLPDGGAAGAYVAYPLEDLLRIVALESHRNHCLVIGEDLGTVPDGFRPRMADAGVLSYRVLYFERDRGSGDFLPPQAWPESALATLTTHDLPPLRGFWTGRDLQWRRELGLYPDEAMAQKDEWDRGVDRWRLLRALDDAGLRPDAYPDNEGAQPWTPELTAAAHRYLAAAPSRILMAAAEDALEETEQPNLPGTVDQHPNWRRRWPVSVAALADHPGMRRLAAACNSRKS